MTLLVSNVSSAADSRTVNELEKLHFENEARRCSNTVLMSNFYIPPEDYESHIVGEPYHIRNEKVGDGEELVDARPNSDGAINACVSSFSSEKELLEAMDRMEKQCEFLTDACDELSSELTRIKLLAYTHDLTLPPEIHSLKYSDSVVPEIELYNIDNNLGEEFIEHEYEVTDDVDTQSSDDNSTIDEDLVEPLGKDNEDDQEFQLEEPIPEENIDHLEKQQRLELIEKMNTMELKEGSSPEHETDVESNQNIQLIHPISEPELCSEVEQQKSEQSLQRNEENEALPRKSVSFCESTTISAAEIPSDPVEQPKMESKEQFISYYDDDFMACENIIDDDLPFESQWVEKSDDYPTEMIQDVETYLSSLRKREDETSRSGSKKSKRRIFSQMIAHLLGSENRSSPPRRKNSLLSQATTDDNSLTETTSTYDSMYSPQTLLSSVSTTISRLEFEHMERCLISLMTGEVMHVSESGKTKPNKRFVWVDTRRLLICWNKGATKSPKHASEFPVTEVRSGDFIHMDTLTEDLNNRSLTAWSLSGRMIVLTASTEVTRNDWVVYLTAVLDIKRRNF